MKLFSFKKNSGITSLEVVVGVSIAGIIIAFAMNALTLFINSARDANSKTQALYLAEEGLELARFIRDENWSSLSALSLGAPHYFSISGSAITFTSTPEVIEGFTRSVVLQNVYRNTTTDDIVASTTSGSAADTHSKYITITVTDGAVEAALTTILTDIAP